MEDVVHLTFEGDVVRDVMLHENEVASHQALDVGGVSGEQVVHGHHGVALIEQVLAQMRSDEAGAAGDQGSWHG